MRLSEEYQFKSLFNPHKRIRHRKHWPHKRYYENDPPSRRLRRLCLLLRAYAPQTQKMRLRDIAEKLSQPEHQVYKDNQRIWSWKEYAQYQAYLPQIKRLIIEEYPITTYLHNNRNLAVAQTNFGTGQQTQKKTVT